MPKIGIFMNFLVKIIQYITKIAWYCVKRRPVNAINLIYIIQHDHSLNHTFHGVKEQIFSKIPMIHDRKCRFSAFKCRKSAFLWFFGYKNPVYHQNRTVLRNTTLCERYKPHIYQTTWKSHVSWCQNADFSKISKIHNRKCRFSAIKCRKSAFFNFFTE